jgi:hypothetical protein
MKKRGGLRVNGGREAYLLLALEHLLDGLGAERLGALERHAEGAVPDELRGDTEGARDTEQDGVERLLLEAVVGEEDTRVGVDVGPAGGEEAGSADESPGRDHERKEGATNGFLALPALRRMSGTSV